MDLSQTNAAACQALHLERYVRGSGIAPTLLELIKTLERLSPVERAVFLLREVFEYDYDGIAQMVRMTANDHHSVMTFEITSNVWFALALKHFSIINKNLLKSTRICKTQIRRVLHTKFTTQESGYGRKTNDA